MNPQALGFVVVAAGSGARFGGPKQWTPLAGRPLLAHSLERLAAAFPDAERVLVLSAEGLAGTEWPALRERLSAPWRAVEGGATRAASVLAGVEALGSDCGLAAVHDGARPFPPIKAIRQCVDRLQEDASLAAAIVCAPVTDTLKVLDGDGGFIERTLDRNLAARAQTPQVCRRARLLEALRAPGAARCTDEGQALERLGLRTAATIHNGYNPKITTPVDLDAAEAWLRSDG